MADKQISALPEATSIGNDDLFAVQQSNQAKKVTGQTLVSELAEALDGHGGIASIELTSTVERENTYTITFADNTTFDFVVTDGDKGNKGDQTYVHIKYSEVYPVVTMLTTPNNYIGIYTGTEAIAPGTISSYTWFQWKGNKGDTGVSIQSITKTGSSGVVDEYTILFDDGNTQLYTVTNGSNISSITKTSSSGLNDIYTVLLSNGATTEFTVVNGKGISSITMVSGSHAAGTIDTYRILFNDGDTFDIPIYNGANGTGAVSTVAGIGVNGSTGDVPLILWGNSAPTSSTVGQEKQLYFNLSSGIMYICLGENSGTYTWASMGITVDNALSSSSSNPVANSVITGKVGTATLTTTAQNLSSAVNELVTGLGSKANASAVVTNVSYSNGVLSQTINGTSSQVVSLLNLIYPVGSIYMSVNATDPSTLFGGTWQRIQDTFILAAGSTYSAGSTGGEATHTLTESELPSHRHSVDQQYLHRLDSSDNNYANYGVGGSLSGWGINTTTNNQGATRLGIQAFNTNSTGSGSAFNIMPPYIAVYVWKRTA